MKVLVSSAKMRFFKNSAYSKLRTTKCSFARITSTCSMKYHLGNVGLKFFPVFVHNFYLGT